MQNLLHSFHSHNFKHILWAKGKIISVKYDVDNSSHGEEKFFTAINMFGGHFVIYANSESCYNVLCQFSLNTTTTKVSERVKNTAQKPWITPEDFGAVERGDKRR